MSSLLWTFLEISVNFFEAFIYLYFFKNRINVCKKSTAADAICLISYTAFLSLYLFFNIPFPDSFGGVMFVFYLHYVSDERCSVCILQGSYCYSNNRIDAPNLPFRSFSPVWPDSSSYSLQTRIHSLNQFRSFYWNVLFFKSKSTIFFFALVCLAYFCCS